MFKLFGFVFAFVSMVGMASACNNVALVRSRSVQRVVVGNHCDVAAVVDHCVPVVAEQIVVPQLLVSHQNFVRQRVVLQDVQKVVVQKQIVRNRQFVQNFVNRVRNLFTPKAAVVKVERVVQRVRHY